MTLKYFQFFLVSLSHNTKFKSTKVLIIIQPFKLFEKNGNKPRVSGSDVNICRLFWELGFSLLIGVNKKTRIMNVSVGNDTPEHF